VVRFPASSTTESEKIFATDYTKRTDWEP